jgi:hypothetical protein
MLYQGHFAKLLQKPLSRSLKMTLLKSLFLPALAVPLLRV